MDGMDTMMGWLHGTPTVLITGGAGFVGSNLADRILSVGGRVIVLDSLNRAGVGANLRWLRERHGDRLRVLEADVRDRSAVAAAMANVDTVFHFAAQVAVTTSVVDPIEDFNVNASGTIAVLEAARSQVNPPAVLFTSTNKVYGALNDVDMVDAGDRCRPADARLWERGVSESRPLDLHSPYGCSKGAADQYMLDYARTFGLRTAVFRMSCIYGPRQFGTEDQGWVAHFLISALESRPLTIYGDGRQVRDVLFVDDLVDAFIAARDNITQIKGRAFNIGGGPANTISLREMLMLAEHLTGSRIQQRSDGWRPGDQRWYVSDTSSFSRATGWTQRVNVREGVQRLLAWLMSERGVNASAATAQDVGR